MGIDIGHSPIYSPKQDGATGVMIPLIKDAAGVESIVDAVKFPPIGNRGMDGAGPLRGVHSFSVGILYT